MKKACTLEGEKQQSSCDYSGTHSEKKVGKGKVSGRIRGYAERLDSIRINLLEAGIEPLNLEALLTRISDTEGKLVRFRTSNKPRSKNGWLVAYFHSGLPAIVIAGDWSTGTKTKWMATIKASLDPGERKDLNRRIIEAREARDRNQALQWERSAIAAARCWPACAPANPQHPYLLRKGIQPHKARQQGRELVLRLIDFNGKTWSLQTIDETGNKRLMAGGKKAGNFILVYSPDYPARVLICEGYATGCTLAKLDPKALVLAAVDCGNLKEVATGARNRWPDADLVICGDDDRATPGNPGATAARSAALATGAKLALPEWPLEAPKHLSDFNDLHQWLRGQL
jgi:putative DNA primase/helicase